MIVSGILDCFSLKFQFFLNFPSPLILTSQLFIFFFFFFTVLKPYFPLLSIKQLSPRFPPTKRQIFIISYRSFCRMCDRRCKKICIKSEFIDTLASTRTISFSNSSVSIYIYIYVVSTIISIRLNSHSTRTFWRLISHEACGHILDSRCVRKINVIPLTNQPIYQLDIINRFEIFENIPFRF